MILVLIKNKLDSSTL